MNTDDSFNFPIRTSHDGNVLSSIYSNPLSMNSIDIDSVSTPGFELLGVTGSSFDSPNGLSYVVTYPQDWQEKNKRFIPHSLYDPNDQIKASEFTLTPSKPKAKYVFFNTFGFPFLLKYPEDWKKYEIKVLEENTWADQYDRDNKDVILSCEFKATYKSEDESDIMERTAGLLIHLPDNTFKRLARIQFESIKKNPINCKLISIDQQSKSFLINYILEKEISHRIINRVANLFFRIIAHHQGRIVNQTNWLEVPAKKNQDNYSETSDHPDTIQNEITPMFKHEDTQRIIEKEVKKIQERFQNKIEVFTQQRKEEITKRFQTIEEEKINFGEISPQISLEPLEPSGFDIQFQYPEKSNVFPSSSRINLLLKYPKSWKHRPIVIDKNNWGDQYHKDIIALFGRFKVTYNMGPDSKAKEVEADLLSRPSDNDEWQELAQLIDQRKELGDDHLYKLEQIQGLTRLKLIQQMLKKIGENVTHFTLNKQTMLFFCVRVYSQNQFMKQTNWLKLPAKLKTTQIFNNSIQCDIEKAIKNLDKESQEFLETCIQQIGEDIEKKFHDLEEQRQGDSLTHKRRLDSEKSQLDESSKKRRVDEPRRNFTC